MKKQFYNFMGYLVTILFVAGSFSNSMAQGAKIEFNEELAGMNTNLMSSNGRYITCGAGNSEQISIAALWDRQTGEVTILGAPPANPVTAFDVSNEGVVVGAFLDPEIMVDGVPIMSGYWWKDNVFHSLGGHPDYSIRKGSRASAITADGSLIAGYVYETATRLVPCTWKWNGETYIFHETYITFPNSFQGARPWDMSDNGVLVGWDSMATGGSVWKPTIWTDPETIVRPEGVLVKTGVLRGINADGTIAVGYTGGGDAGVMIGVDGSFEFFPVPLYAIASNGMVIHKTGVYTERIGIWELFQYLKKFWNIEIDETRYSMEVASVVSVDGKYIGGWLWDNNLRGRIPFVVTLDGYPVALAPDVVNTTLKQVAGEVVVTWEKPVYNGYEPIGYNVYRDGEKLNVDGLIEEFTFTDIEPEVGANCYSITAVYTYDSEIESAKSIASCVEVIAEDGCFSPKHLAAEIIYNKTVNLSWRMPLPNYGSIQPSKSASENVENTESVPEPTKIKPVYLKTYQIGAVDDYETDPASDGNYIYVKNSRDFFSKYTADGDFVQKFKLGSPMLPNYFGGLTYCDDGFYYTTSRLNLNGRSIKLDLDNREIANTIVSENNILKSRITYIPDLDGGNGGFEIGNKGSSADVTPGTSYYYKKDLMTEIGVGLQTPTDIWGTAYHDGTIYGTVHKDGELIIKLFDMETGVETGEYIDIRDYTNPNLTFTNTAKLAGITTFKSTEGILCLVVLVMDSPNNSLVFLQLEQMEGLLGYDVYRNGTKINNSTIVEGLFSEDVTVSGDYKYTVRALYEGGCVSSDSFPVDVTINPLGTCNTPKDVAVELIRNNAQMTWTAPKATAPHKLVGYNIYRDDVQLNSKLIMNTFYTDTKLPFGDYSYTVEAFYNNSCVSDKSAPAVARVLGYNVPTAPTNLTATVDNSTQATLNWTEPSVGDYANLRWYSGAVEWGIGEEVNELIYVASKWNANDLALYFDYTLTDVEFYPMADVPHTFYVYVDGQVVLEQYVATVIPNNFNLLKLNRAVLVEKGKDLMVGYKVAGMKKGFAIGADKGKNRAGKGDLMSYDGKTWKSAYDDYKVAATWAITIRLMPYSISEASEVMADVTLESCTEGEIRGFENEAKSIESSIFVNKEVIGYNVYKDASKIGSVNGTTYQAEIDNSSNSCYTVEALYTSGRVSPKTDKVCIYGECQPALELKGTGGGMATLTWTAPTGETTEPVELKYCEDNAGGGIVFAEPTEFYALIQSTVLENLKYGKLKLKSIEALVKGECEISIVAIQDGKIILDKAINNITVGDINVFEVPDGGIAIDPSKNIMVGLKVNAPAALSSIGLDPGPAVSNRGDVFGSDINSLTTIFLASNANASLNCNWNIWANFEQVIPSTETVLEYNIYRDGVKIDSSNMNSFSDETVESNTEYEYYVTTVWNTGCTSAESNRVKVKIDQVGVNDLNSGNISIFPNPTKNRVNIKGEYSSLRMYNSVGVMILEQSEKSDYINIAGLEKGIYIIELSNDTEVINRTKLVVN